MSGDVQPRKRKDKKKKKDELGLEEPRGTAAALGDGDVFMHSHSDHGTGGHWCAKIIFFSLLAVLCTLIGLIILENRGLSELEANAVESRYSNILEGWLEDVPDDDHHDEHTLELKHHDDDEEDDRYDSHDVDDHNEDDHNDEHADEDDEEHEDANEHDDDENEDEHAEEDEDEHEDEDEQEDEDDEPNDGEDSQQELEEADEDEDDRSPYKYYREEEDEENNEDDTGEDDEDDTGEDDEDEQETAQDENEQQDEAEDQDEQNDDNESNEELENEDEDSEDRYVAGDEDEETNENDEDDENQTGEDEEEHEDHEDEDEDDELEVEKIEREASEEEPISIGLPALPEEDDDDDDDKDKDDDHDESDDDADNEADDDADDDFLEADVPPVVERVSAPAGKPFVEVDEDDDSTEKPPDTLEEEEEYEKQQEEKRKEEEQSSHHIWLKLSVGAALLVATHAVLRRAAAPRDEAAEEIVEREETPVVDRRMTLIPEAAAPPVIPKKEIEKPVVEEIVRRESPVVKTSVIIKQESEEEETEEPELEDVVEEEEIEEDEPEKLEAPHEKTEEEKELYSDEEIEEEEEEEVIIPKKEAPKAAATASKTPAPAPKAAEPAKTEPEPEEEDPDDVEIIDDELLEEELEEEEEVSDVDDSELLRRLEAKYGRLPEPERPGQTHKDGGNSVEDAWPGEPADAYWRQQLDSAERDLRQGAWSAAAERAGSAELRPSARARYIAAAALDRLAEARRDNGLLSRAIAAYFSLLEMSDRLSDKKLVEVTRRTLNRIQFRGNYLKAEPVYRILIRRFPDEPAYRNNLTVSFLMANRNDLAENTLKETLARWPDDRVALVHYAFILKTNHKDRLEEAVELFQKALEGDEGPACEPRFYYHYGDALLLLGRYKEANDVHNRGATLGHFLSSAQRSLYNVPRLKSRPWWNVNETPYSALARNLEKRWKEILKEGQKAAALFEKEQEGLKERGEWSQMDLFVRGQEIPGRCAVAPVTCSVVKGELSAAGCRRGQVKFSLMAPGTHVRPHVGPTNCRLRMHLALSNTKNTFLRVDQETRQWQEGKVLLFDDSFEHEVWHNGTAARLVLIVDVWHPDLTAAERRSLPAI